MTADTSNTINPQLGNEFCQLPTSLAFNLMKNYGYCLVLAQRENEGIAVYEQCEKQASDNRGEGIDKHSLASLPHLSAIALYRCGEYKQAIDCEIKAIELLEELWGPTSTKLCGPYNTLGHAHYALGELDEALACFKEANWIAANRWDCTHERLINSNLNLARCYNTLCLQNDSSKQFDEYKQASAERFNTAMEGIRASTEMVIGVLDQGEWESSAWHSPPYGFLKAKTIEAEMLESHSPGKALELYECLAEYHRKHGADTRALGRVLLKLSKVRMRTHGGAGSLEALKECEACFKNCLKSITGSHEGHPLWKELVEARQAVSREA